jgi:hypothetical protein
MSRDLTGTASYLRRNDRLGLSNYPLSVFIWFWADTIASTNRALVNISQDTSAQLLSLNILTSNSKVEISTFDSTYSYRTAITSTTVTTGAWQSAAGVWQSTTNRSVYLNGGGKASNTDIDAVDFSALNRTTVGGYGGGVPVELFDGRLAHCAVWNVALADAEMEILHSGLSPLRVRPASLVAYWSLSGKDDPEIDIVGRNDLTITSAAASNDEPRIFRNYV